MLDDDKCLYALIPYIGSGFEHNETSVPCKSIMICNWILGRMTIILM